MTELARLIDKHLNGTSIAEAAQQCGLTYWNLYDILNNRLKTPPRPEHLQKIADGLGISYRKLALAAYTPQEVTA